MRSTDRSLLTISFRRAEMVAFWIVVTAIIGLLMGLGSAAFGAQQPWIWRAGALGVLGPGLAWSPWFEWGIRAWNKGTSIVASALRAYVLTIGYYLLFGAVGRAGSNIDKAPSGEVSGWIPRIERAPYASIPSTYRGWQLSLLPVLAVLRLLGHEQQDNTPSQSSYTLY